MVGVRHKELQSRRLWLVIVLLHATSEVIQLIEVFIEQMNLSQNSYTDIIAPQENVSVERLFGTFTPVLTDILYLVWNKSPSDMFPIRSVQHEDR